jgi:general stress protein YciG
MNPDEQRKLASKGGKAAHAQGRVHTWDSKSAAEAGRRGAAARVKNRKAAMPY